eukprot:SAG31_NODE_84_length_27014_cov_3.743006_1_plen_115_part_00
MWAGAPLPGPAASAMAGAVGWRSGAGVWGSGAGAGAGGRRVAGGLAVRGRAGSLACWQAGARAFQFSGEISVYVYTALRRDLIFFQDYFLKLLNFLDCARMSPFSPTHAYAVRT